MGSRLAELVQTTHKPCDQCDQRNRTTSNSATRQLGNNATPWNKNFKNIKNVIQSRHMAELITQTGIPYWLQPPKKTTEPVYAEWVWYHALERIAAGETLTSICSDPVMPEYGPFLTWVFAKEERKTEYYKARALGAERIEDQMVDIADGVDGPMNDTQRDALRISTRKWLLGVWNRNRYGEARTLDINVALDIGDAMAKAALRIDNNVIDVEVEE
jgi:hypothetical protein